MSDRFGKEYVASIKEEINKIEGVRGCYDLILNNYGHDTNIGSVHIGVKDDLTAKEIQSIERKIAILLYEKYHTIMTVGIYADNQSDPLSRAVFETVSAAVKEYSHVLQTHGFYIDEKEKVISFDLVISFDDPDPAETIRAIKEKVEGANEGYRVFIQYDQDFSLSE